MTVRNLFRTLAAASALFAASNALSQSEDKPLRQTEIESVRLKVQNDGDNAYFLFSEAIILRATNLVLECDQLEVFATRAAEAEGDVGKYGAIKEVIASGNVRITQEQRVATCQKAVVQPGEERIVLSGNPVVEQPGGRVITLNPEDEIILDRGNGQININTKGPNKLRLIGSPIRDLGFEEKEPIPQPQPLDESVNEQPPTDSDSKAKPGEEKSGDPQQDSTEKENSGK